MNAPTNSPARYSGTSPHSVLPWNANPSVTAGLMCAPLNCPTAKMASATAMPHPNVMTIQPPFWALDWLSSTPATTPFPNRTRIAVPITSAPKMLKAAPLPRIAWTQRAGHYADRGPGATDATGDSVLIPERAGGGLQQQLRRRRARVLVADAARAEVVGPPAAGLERDGRPHALLRRVRRAPQRVGQPAAFSGAQRLQGRHERVDHRLVAGLGLAPRLNPLDSGLHRGGPAGEVELLATGGRHAHLQEQGSVQRAGGSADARDQRHPDRLEQRADVLALGAVELLDRLAHAAIHVGAVVAVADRRVEPDQLGAVLGDLGGVGADPVAHLCRGDAQGGPPSADAQRRRVGGRVPQPRQLVVEPEQSDRAARHLERGDVVADQPAVDGDAASLEEAVQLAVDDVELDQRRAAHPVHERQHAVAGVERQVLDDRRGEALDYVRCGSERLPEAARLAVDADPDLHLVVAELEARLAGARCHAGGQRHPHAAALSVDGPAELGHLGERLALLGGRPADLLGDDRDPDAAPAGGVEAVLDGDVVVRDHGLDIDPLALGEVGGHLEVHHVARVVLDDVQHARATVDRLGRLEHLVGSRRGEHLARARGVEHAAADEPAVHRLVAGASARHDPPLSPDRRGGAPHHVRVVAHAHLVAMCGLDALERLADHGVRLIDQLLHPPTLLALAIGPGSGETVYGQIGGRTPGAPPLPQTGGGERLPVRAGGGSAE